MIQRLKAVTEDLEGPFASWLSWGHFAISLSLVAFVYNLWMHSKAEAEASAIERVKLEGRIVVMETKQQAQLRIDREQNEALLHDLQMLTQRIDAQRADIRSMQELIIRHMQMDRR